MSKKMMNLYLFSFSLLLLSACSSFTGLRTPTYDGKPFVAESEKIEAYAQSREIIGEEQDLYLPEPFSEDILQPSLEPISHEPLLLSEGTYTIGEDLPAGRVSLLGEKENPRVSFGGFEDSNAPINPESFRVGTMTIRDAEGVLYFENMFHPYYGVMIAQVDFVEGHTIEIVGSTPEVVVFYADELPADPYVFDTREEEFYADLEDLEEGEFITSSESTGFEIEQEQPLKISEDGRMVELKAGIYEVGKHLEPGTYEMTEESAPTHTEIFLFSAENDTRIFEIKENLYGPLNGYGFLNVTEDLSNRPVIELTEGEKIYLHYVDYLLLTKLEK